MYIACEINLSANDLGANFALGNSLLRPVKFTKNDDPDKVFLF